MIYQLTGTDSRDERGRGSRDGRMDKHDYTMAPKRVSTNIDMNKLSGANQVGIQLVNLEISWLIECVISRFVNLFITVAP